MREREVQQTNKVRQPHIMSTHSLQLFFQPLSLLHPDEALHNHPFILSPVVYRQSLSLFITF